MKSSLFEKYTQNLKPEYWRDFPALMWNLGFEMDCYRSAPYDNNRRRYASEKEVQDALLTSMKDWTTQQVGNYIFSRYRELTHWSDFGYPEEQGAYFFEKAFPILEDKLKADWEERNSIPPIEKFTEWVNDFLKEWFEDEILIEFVSEEEGKYHLEQQYNQYLQMCEAGEMSVPMFRGKAVKETAYLLKDMC